MSGWFGRIGGDRRRRGRFKGEERKTGDVFHPDCSLMSSRRAVVGNGGAGGSVV